MTVGPEAAAYTGDIQAVHRVADILRLFSLDTPRMSVAHAAQRVGLNRTTVHRYFSTLVAAQLLERDPEEPSLFVPGPLLLQLGAIAQGRRQVIDVARRHLHELSTEVQLTAVLSLWGSSGPVVSLVSEATTRNILVTVRVGTQLGAESAQTYLFLALMQDQDDARRWIEALPAGEQKDLKRRIAVVRKEGISRMPIPAVDGVVVATAVFDQHGLVATIALVGTTSSLSLTGSDKEDALVETARVITEELAGTHVAESLRR